MKQFRIIINNKVSEWFNADEWTLEDMNQLLELPISNMEYREA